ncbi:MULTISPECIES: SH3 domain-containing protein [Caldilinea]|uniref:SH3b domain-containing protein n=1 Tax=Caldilinea aerophila (strain DSM 14535 / JCM 11387 / NBRC 104270 / STL-6-O1) TaxID=926550 RepID=I0I1W7_CALAS|nr:MULTISPECIES: SH3 domain-containing protein [Caldilinea]BAL99254.1 hypothetical protein CLDAP_12150 [Caldilinea aerophila DSM 14535 = NBRC 104270]GIV74153.1 MAG: hypothetical protein KatS3mg049_2709 [Caldilinea sp.]
MTRVTIALILACFLLIGTGRAVHADDDYLVPITVGSRTFTLTVSVGETGISVRVSDPTVRLGTVAKVPKPEEVAAQQDLTSRKAQAVTIPYDDLFRYNERHVGKTVRYVGKVLQVQEKECFIFCEEGDQGYILRVAVTRGSYGLWDDAIWVDYPGTQRFLEDDIVTVWGVVEGLQKYTAVLGNQITIPKIKAIDIQLGEVANPRLPAAPGSPVANRNANLRGGPGTHYPVVGGVRAGDALDVVARNQAGDWLQLRNGNWIAAFLVDNAPADLPVATEIPAPPAPSTGNVGSGSSTPATTGAPAGDLVAIGQEIEGGGWRFKVSEVRKRKAVYFYGNSYIAMGRFLIVVIDATNLQSGTDYFYRNISPVVVDEKGKRYSFSGVGSGYAQWQLGGLDSLFTNVNPGNSIRLAFAVDLPEATGRIYLRTDVGKRVDLGDFAAMASEDN